MQRTDIDRLTRFAVCHFTGKHSFAGNIPKFEPRYARSIRNVYEDSVTIGPHGDQWHLCSIRSNLCMTRNPDVIGVLQRINGFDAVLRSNDTKIERKVKRVVIMPGDPKEGGLGRGPVCKTSGICAGQICTLERRHESVRKRATGSKES